LQIPHKEKLRRVPLRESFHSYISPPLDICFNPVFHAIPDEDLGMVIVQINARTYSHF